MEFPRDVSAYQFSNILTVIAENGFNEMPAQLYLCNLKNTHNFKWYFLATLTFKIP